MVNGSSATHAITAEHPTVLAVVEAINKTLKRRAVRNVIITACEDRMSLRMTIKVNTHSKEAKVQLQLEDAP